MENSPVPLVVLENRSRFQTVQSQPVKTRSCSRYCSWYSSKQSRYLGYAVWSTAQTTPSWIFGNYCGGSSRAWPPLVASSPPRRGSGLLLKQWARTQSTAMMRESACLGVLQCKPLTRRIQNVVSGWLNHVMATNTSVGMESLKLEMNTPCGMLFPFGCQELQQP